MQFKGGVLYDIGNALSFLNFIPIVGKTSDESDIWFNFGFIDKAPIFDQVIQDWDAKMSTDPKMKNSQPLNSELILILTMVLCKFNLYALLGVINFLAQ